MTVSAYSLNGMNNVNFKQERLIGSIATQRFLRELKANRL